LQTLGWHHGTVYFVHSSGVNFDARAAITPPFSFHRFSFPLSFRRRQAILHVILHHRREIPNGIYDPRWWFIIFCLSTSMLANDRGEERERERERERELSTWRRCSTWDHHLSLKQSETRFVFEDSCSHSSSCRICSRPIVDYQRWHSIRFYRC